MRVRCGIDIIETERIEKALKRSARFADKVFTETEILYCDSRNAGKYESYAARFAAKEAFLKSLGTGLFSGAALNEIEVVNDAETGEPSMRLSGGAARLYGEKGGISLAVSLSHTGKTAAASVVMLCGT